MDKLKVLLFLLLASFSGAQTTTGGTTNAGGVTENMAQGPSVVSIAITPLNASQVVASGVGYTAIANLSNGLTANVSTLAVWVSSNPAIAAVGTLTNTQAINCVSAGSATVAATYANVSAATPITCTPLPPPPPPVLQFIVVNPANPTVSVGQSTGFSATGTYSDGTVSDVTSLAVWSSSDPTITTIAAASNPQLVNCKNAGTAIITATVNTVSGHTNANCVAQLVSISVTPANPSITVGTLASFVATGTFSDGTQKNVSSQAAWTSSSAVATLSGLATTSQAVLCGSAGSSTIAAAVGVVSGSTTLTCTPPAPPPSLMSIAVTPASPSQTVGQNLGFIATGTFSDGTQQNLTTTAAWASGTPAHATLGTLTTTQAVHCAAAGTSLISATQSAITGSTTLTCVAPVPTLVSISVTPASPTVVVGTTVTFIATGTYSDSTTQDLTLSSVWTSGTLGVATIGTSADPQPALCVGAGTSVITATNGAIHGSTTLTCNAPPPPTLLSIAVSPVSPSIAVGQIANFTATGTYSDGSTQNVTAAALWASSSSNATLSGLTATENVTCVHGGSSSISATIGVINGNTTLSCSAVLTSLVVTPGTPQTNVGTAQNFIATCNYNDGSVADCTLQSTWASSSTAVAALAAKADPQPVNCLTPGTSTISATIGANSGNTILTCLAVGPPPPTLTSITVTPASPTLNVGSSVGLIATCNFSDGTTKDCTLSQGTNNTGWTSGTPTVVTLSPLKDPEVVTCLMAGTSLISATNAAITGTTTVTCQNPTPTLSSIAVTPTNPVQFVGSSVGFTATCTYSDSSTANCTTASQGTATVWTSANLSTATIGAASSPQNVNCIAIGATTIKAAVGATNGTTIISCQAVVPPSFGLDAYCAAGNIPSFGVNDSFAQLPQTCYYTNPSVRPTPGTVRIANAANWTTTWAATACDDVVEIAAGTTITGPFTIPAATCAAGHYRTLRVTGFASSFPAYGGIRKVSPCYWGIASLPGYPSFNCSSTVNRGATIQSTGTAAPLTLAAGFDGLQIEGIKLTRTAGTGIISSLINKTNGAHLILDSDWCAATGGNDETTRCINLDRITYAAIINSVLTNFVCKVSGGCQDGQAISGGLNSSGVQDGTWKIVNNFCSASGQGCLLMGGGSANIVPNDLEYRLNWSFAPLTWNPADPAFAGVMYQRKNAFELKNCNRCFIEGSDFSNSWAGFSQSGPLLVLTPKNQGGGCAICAVTNVTIRYNFATTGNQAIAIANVASDSGALATAGNSYSIHDNVFENLNYATCYKCANNSGGALDGGALTQQNAGLSFVLGRVFINHNDYIPAAGSFSMGGTLGISGPLASSGRQMSNYTWTNNLILREPQNNAGSNPINNPLDSCSASPVSNCYCGNSGSPATVLNACFATYSFGGNALVNGAGKAWPGTNCTAETSLANIFVAYNGGFNGPTGVANYTVKTASPCHLSATDGRDPGADIPTLQNRIQGVATF